MWFYNKHADGIKDIAVQRHCHLATEFQFQRLVGTKKGYHVSSESLEPAQQVVTL